LNERRRFAAMGLAFRTIAYRTINPGRAKSGQQT
jgi:hypothetical protein